MRSRSSTSTRPRVIAGIFTAACAALTKDNEGSQVGQWKDAPDALRCQSLLNGSALSSKEKRQNRDSGHGRVRLCVRVEQGRFVWVRTRPRSPKLKALQPKSGRGRAAGCIGGSSLHH